MIDVGIYSAKQLSNEGYHADPAISRSHFGFKTLLHYWEEYVNPARPPREETPAMAFGTALHTLLLEPDQFSSGYVLEPSRENYPSAVSTIDEILARAAELDISIPKGRKDKMFAALKERDPEAALWDELLVALTSGKRVLKLQDWDALHRMRDSIMSHPVARELFPGGYVEQSFFWRDAFTGEMCKTRPDHRDGSGLVVSDIKTTRDASLEEFQRSSYSMGYHRQAAWNLDGIKATQEQVGMGDASPAPETFIFWCVEKEPPFAAAFYFADPEQLELGRQECQRDLALISSARKSGIWPGYPQEIRPCGLPRWAKNKATEHLGGGIFQ